MNKPDVKKLILLNLPYVFAFYFADKIAAVFRLAPGAAFIDKLTNGFAVFGSAFANPLPSFHPVDLLIGLSAGVLLKLAVYVKGKNRKKFRQGEEYGSAEWGNAKQIDSKYRYHDKFTVEVKQMLHRIASFVALCAEFITGKLTEEERQRIADALAEELNKL